MNKKLNISAIIPKELYVQRDADRKLKEVIQLMSKPAYISVSRQMGKTNLLINTKRELQNENNRYVFIDITGSFTSSQDCFRYIVNQILDSNEDIEAFETASKFINDKRKESLERSSTEEFQSEIRTILKYFKGNLIIFLDEVDDLVKHSFSDEIFGQIRKTYFIRETYDALKRVTYVLSGVIDPEKLIKSKENSPFNIAIPIYLQDFTYEEYEEFVDKSNLPITKEIREYIYDWLSGNPRMTFDVLSLIEDEYIGNNIITKKLVDDVIQTIYLNSYKQPPVDHIRDLVKHDTEVRKALINLKKGALSELSDSSINKLFLYGIVKSKIKNNVVIKNRVIEACLSDDWLEKVELEKKGYYEYGIDKLNQGLYDDGIFYFKEYINNNPSGKLVNLANYKIGEANFNLKNYSEAIEYLSKKPIKKETSLELYFGQMFYLGTSYFRKDFLNEAETIYNEIIDQCTNVNTVISSMINKGELTFTPQIVNYEKAITLYNSVILYINQHSEDIIDNNNLLSIAYYRIGCAYYELQNKEEALPNFEKSLELAKIENTPEILLYIDSCLDSNREDRFLHYINIAETIIENKITFDLYENSIIQFPEFHLHLCLLNLYNLDQKEIYEKLINYSIKEIYKYKTDIPELTYKLATFSYGLNERGTGEKLLLSIIERNDSSEKIKQNSYLVLGLITPNEKETIKEPYISYLLKFVAIFQNNNNWGNPITVSEVNAFLHIITYYRERNEFKKSYEIATIVTEYYNDQLDNETKASIAILFYFIVDYFSFAGDLINAQIYGEKTLAIMAKINPFLNDLSYVDKSFLKKIEALTKNIIYKGTKAKVINPIKTRQQIGRNEYVTVRYKDGRSVTTKFKKVEHDIRNGECIIDES